MTDFKKLGKGAAGISEKPVSRLSLLEANVLQIPIHLDPGSHLLRRLTQGYKDCTPLECGIGFFIILDHTQFITFLCKLSLTFLISVCKFRGTFKVAITPNSWDLWLETFFDEKDCSTRYRGWGIDVELAVHGFHPWLLLLKPYRLLSITFLNKIVPDISDNCLLWKVSIPIPSLKDLNNNNREFYSRKSHYILHPQPCKGLNRDAEN